MLLRMCSDQLMSSSSSISSFIWSGTLTVTLGIVYPRMNVCKHSSKSILFYVIYQMETSVSERMYPAVAVEVGGGLLQVLPDSEQDSGCVSGLLPVFLHLVFGDVGLDGVGLCVGVLPESVQLIDEVAVKASGQVLEVA